MDIHGYTASGKFDETENPNISTKASVLISKKFQLISTKLTPRKIGKFHEICVDAAMREFHGVQPLDVLTVSTRNGSESKRSTSV